MNVFRFSDTSTGLEEFISALKNENDIHFNCVSEKLNLAFCYFINNFLCLVVVNCKLYIIN